MKGLARAWRRKLQKWAIEMWAAPTVKKMILNVSPLLGLNAESAGTIIQESQGRAASFCEPNQVPVRAPQRMVARLSSSSRERNGGGASPRRRERRERKTAAQKKIRP